MLQMEKSHISTARIMAVYLHIDLFLKEEEVGWII